MLYCFLLLFHYLSIGQLSPGKLTSAHAKLEGMSNCTQCHTIGDKVANQKCLACHKEINSRISKNKGFHVSASVRGKECIVCHSEHHGTNFDMVRFDQKTFNHNLTGFELKGAHKTKIVNCKECHKADNITDASVKNRRETFLGLDTKCLSCHDDYHQKTLSSECTSCHDVNSFKKAPAFNHNSADFALKGAHKSVDCASCHKSEVRNNQKFVRYSGLSFNNCNSCHKDAHKGRFGNNCEACHTDTEDSFNKIVPTRAFNHSVTGYALEGKHHEISCKKCHDNSNSASGNFQEFSKKENITCASCHKDVHEGKLGNDCKSCHNQHSFLLKNKTFVGKFDHDKTNYPLVGKHQAIDCKSCHKSDLTDPVQHNTCMSCHTDKHNGDFANKKEKYPDCATCHSEKGFSPSKFNIEMHNKGAFKLEGAHLAQPCFACHLQNNKWIFAKMDTQCSSCHQDIHQGFLDKKYYGERSCEACHQVESWQKITFDHKTTGYELKGGHSSAQCASCHFDKSVNPAAQKFKGLSKQCASCHANIHGNQFEQKGITDCARCHSASAWDGKLFNHDRTAFKLDGKHQGVSCDKCHKQTITVNNRSVKFFKIQKYQCVDCHL